MGSVPSVTPSAVRDSKTSLTLTLTLTPTFGGKGLKDQRGSALRLHPQPEAGQHGCPPLPIAGGASVMVRVRRKLRLRRLRLRLRLSASVRPAPVR